MMHSIENFIQSNELVLNLGIVSYTDRKNIYNFSHSKNLHTMSIHKQSNSDTELEPIKELLISKIPFQITDIKLESSIINELKFITKIGPHNSIADILNNSTDKNKIKVEQFLFQFSFEFSNNYHRLFEHRKNIISKAKEEIDKILIPKPNTILKRPNSTKKFFIPAHHEKHFVRMDMISAVSRVIGIHDWSKFMEKFTSIDLYCTSKALRGVIMKNIHTQCMLLVKEHVYNLIARIPFNLKNNFLYIGQDECIMEFDSDTNYIELMNTIDPDKYFRIEIFQLMHKYNETNSWYIECHQDGTTKIKSKL